MRVHFSFFIIIITVLLSCKVKKTTNGNTFSNKLSDTEINFIPYYLEAEKAKKLYENQQYDKSYHIIDSLFDKYGVRNSFAINECMMFLDMSVKLKRTDNLENVVRYMSSKMGFALVNFEDEEQDFILKNTTIDSLSVARFIDVYKQGLKPALQDTLKAMIERDQKVRMDGYDADAFQKVAALNNRQLINIIKINGFPTVDQIEEIRYIAFIEALLMHLETIEKLEMQPILYSELKKGRIPPYMYARMLDKETIINQNNIGFPYYGTVKNRMPSDSIECNNARETIGLPRIKFSQR